MKYKIKKSIKHLTKRIRKSVNHAEIINLSHAVLELSQAISTIDGNNRANSR